MTGSSATAESRDRIIARTEALRADAERLGRVANRISLGRLLAFVAAVAVGGAGVSQGSHALLAAGAGLLVGFFALVVVHARVHARKDDAETRRGVQNRNLMRHSGAWIDLHEQGEGLLPENHPYAHDLDLVGRGSLFQRIDVTRTVRGAAVLARWLGEPADAVTIAQRQIAVRELAGKHRLREDLEAAGRFVRGEERLDHSPFLRFTERPSTFRRMAWLIPVIHVLPPATLLLYLAGNAGMIPAWGWGAGLLLQVLLMWLTGRKTSAAFDLIAARRGYIEAFQRTLTTVERADLSAPLLRELQGRLAVSGRPPSAYLRRLDRWAGLAELRTQFPLNIVANVFLLWDLHVLYRLERWNEDIGQRVEDVFTALGEVEALSSLAGLLESDPTATFPEIVDAETPLTAEGLAHPLLAPDTRVANDVALRGPGTALIVTGSNMAGKSTLLRSVGINVALALGGGPVCARRMRVPRVRLRASMRAEDSLARGASYFHAELQKLRQVVDDAEADPPVLFLLDELLRGTNARARHLGARAVLRHLLERRAMGLVATHDVALSELEAERPDQVANVHFTDVMIGGEMTFDYRLRPGVVQTSNALHLLRLAGVDVAEEDEMKPAAAPPEAVESGSS